MAGAEIVFRVDAGLDIGTGHVMRCLTLADELRAAGAHCRFICRAHRGHLAATIRARGHDVQLLPAPTGAPPAGSGPAHAHWLGVAWAQDAADTIHALNGARPDWLIVDHYALDARWAQRLRPQVAKIAVLDDLADRTQDCDLLLDPGIGRTPADYATLLPAPAQLLLGPQYALLRPEFRAWRARSLARRQQPQLKQLLITMGGVDRQNATGRVLDALDQCPLPVGTRITVVLGQTAPWRAQVVARATTLHHPTEVRVDVHDMAQLMASADLAIGAAGSTSWERCCMGLPSLVCVLADNQQPVAAALAQAGAALSLGRVADADWPARLRAAIASLATPQAAAALSARAAAICDGNGARRAAAAICPPQYTLRAADAGDARRVWDWRYTDVPAEYYASAHIPSLAEHQRWFAQALTNPARRLLMLCRNAEPVCHLRLDDTDTAPATAEVSICVAPDWRGLGVAGPALRLAIRHGAVAGIRRFVAAVHRENGASIALFRKCGFTQTNDQSPFLRFELDAADADCSELTRNA